MPGGSHGDLDTSDKGFAIERFADIGAYRIHGAVADARRQPVAEAVMDLRIVPPLTIEVTTPAETMRGQPVVAVAELRGGEPPAGAGGWLDVGWSSDVGTAPVAATTAACASAEPIPCERHEATFAFEAPGTREITVEAVGTVQRALDAAYVQVVGSKDFVWHRVSTEVPEELRQEQPPFTTVRADASAGKVAWDHVGPGPSGNLYSEFAFVIDFNPPDPVLEAGETHTFDLTVSGALVDASERGRGLGAVAILVENDIGKKNGEIAAFRMSCVVNGDDKQCTPDGSAPGSISTTLPDSAEIGSLHSIGIGVLNCRACYLRYEYKAEPR